MIKNWAQAFSRVRGILMRRGHPGHEAEDLVQEAWLRLNQYAQEQEVLEPEAFLMRVATNLSKDVRRSARGRSEQVLLDDVALVDQSPGVEAILLARQQLVRLDECVARLDARTRAIFLAHRVNGMSYQDIARRHRLSVSAVEKHIAKATLSVANGMEGWWP
jgi:RNA polymerase sigma-70 factor (ECF subfamily)